jgi:hypothetical protein
MSNWISTNKKLSAEPTISKRLAEDFSQILTLSTTDNRRTLQPKIIETFEYQTDVDLKKFEKKCTEETERLAAGYPKVLSSDEYIKYIKDPFNNVITMAFLNKESPRETWTGHRAGGRQFHPPFGITFESLTSDVGSFDHKSRSLDVRHLNAYVLVPRMVYTLSTKLKKEAIHNLIGQPDEVQLIKFITRYGYATRGQPFCKLHCAYARYTNNINNVNYINNCDDWHRIIPVTVFLVVLFNACLMYQPDEPKEGRNLLITALNGFDYGLSINDDTFMNTLSKCFCLIKLFIF